MKTKITTKLTLLAMAVGLMLQAQAQEVGYILNNSTIPAGGSNSAVVFCGKGKGVAIQSSTKLMGAGTAGVACVFEASNDYANWATTPLQFWRAANGATAVSHATNFDIGAIMFLRVTVHNSNSVPVTNSTITAITKAEYR